MAREYKEFLLKQLKELVLDGEGSEEDFSEIIEDTAQMWQTFLGITINTHEVLTMLLMLKINRLQNAFTRENMLELSATALRAIELIDQENATEVILEREESEGSEDD